MGRPKLPPKHLTGRRLDDAAADFVEMVKTSVSADSGTPAAKAVIVNALVERFGAARQVWTLTCGDFDDALAWIVSGADEVEAAERKEQGRRARRGRHTRGSISGAQTTLRQFAEHAQRHRWLDVGVTLKRQIVQPAKERLDGDADAAEMPRVPIEQWDEILMLASAIHQRCRMAVALGLYCGRRVSEVIHLQWRHIDWEREEIRFYNRKRGRWITLPLFPDIRAELEMWRDWAEREYGPVQPDWYLVPNRTANPRGVNALVVVRRQPWRWPVVMTQQSRAETVQADVRRLLGGLGIGANEGTGTHTWRRSAAQAMADRHGLLAAQALLDHKSIVSTQIYTGEQIGRTQLWAALMGGTRVAGKSNVVAIRRAS